MILLLPPGLTFLIFFGVGAWRNHPLFFTCTQNSCVISWNQCFLVEFLVAVWYRIVWISSCFVRHREGWLFVEMVGLSLIAVEPFWICCWFLNIFFYLGLDACMKAMPLKHRTPFFFNYFHHLFFSGVGSCVGLLSYILCSMEFLAPFIGVAVLSYFYRVATMFCLGHFSKFHLFHIIKNSEITAANEQRSIPVSPRKFRTWNLMLFYLFLPEWFWSSIHSTWVPS